VDITDGIPKNVTIFWCKGCGRYLQPPNYWLIANLESNELLSYCLKRVKGLNKVKLIDAVWVWTEPHSKRLKIKLTIQQEVFSGTILQQSFIIEYVVQNHFCDDCHKVEAKDTWVAVCQVRQHANHKRTFLWLEQMILKHKANSACIRIAEQPDGLDFFFSVQNQCTKFISFIQQILPVRWATAKQLQAHDAKSNVFTHTYSYSVEIPSICKDELVCIPARLSNSLGGISPLLLCSKVSNVLHFIDPFTLRECTMVEDYWTYMFRAVAGRHNLQEFVVLDVEPTNVKNGKWTLAEVTVARQSDFGRNDIQFHTLTHLGNYLNYGDTVAGYDLTTINFNDQDLAHMKMGKVRSDIILVRKSFPNRRNRTQKERYWDFERLDIDEMERKDRRSNDMDLEGFKRDLEEDPEMRSQINLFRVPGVPVHDPEEMPEDGDEQDFPDIRIEELIDSVDHLRIH
jgi:nonsense-mediated mRNA decay protein 3